MIPIPPIQPWMLKGGAILLFLSAIFYAGCHTQRQHDAKKIDRLKADYTRAVEIIEVFQENYDTLDRAIEEQNEAIADLGREHTEKVASIKKANEKAIARLTRNNSATVRRAEDEAAALRERMAGLSAGEACHEAMVAIAQ